MRRTAELFVINLSLENERSALWKNQTGASVRLIFPVVLETFLLRVCAIRADLSVCGCQFSL
jgi:hypothetical protein